LRRFEWFANSSVSYSFRSDDFRGLEKNFRWNHRLTAKVTPKHFRCNGQPFRQNGHTPNDDGCMSEDLSADRFVWQELTSMRAFSCDYYTYAAPRVSP
jgi:hypothetical protein